MGFNNRQMVAETNRHLFSSLITRRLEESSPKLVQRLEDFGAGILLAFLSWSQTAVAFPAIVYPRRQGPQGEGVVAASSVPSTRNSKSLLETKKGLLLFLTGP